MQEGRLRAEGALQSLSASVLVQLRFQCFMPSSVNLCASVSQWFKAAHSVAAGFSAIAVAGCFGDGLVECGDGAISRQGSSIPFSPSSMQPGRA